MLNKWGISIFGEEQSFEELCQEVEQMEKKFHTLKIKILKANLPL
ncbi:hypothetical protein [Okeania sp. SIO3I5]|nr:hypothetical protein [Okeania sp. SIO3I5]